MAEIAGDGRGGIGRECEELEPRFALRLVEIVDARSYDRKGPMADAIEQMDRLTA